MSSSPVMPPTTTRSRVASNPNTVSAQEALAQVQPETESKLVHRTNSRGSQTSLNEKTGRAHHHHHAHHRDLHHHGRENFISRIEEGIMDGIEDGIHDLEDGVEEGLHNFEDMVHHEFGKEGQEQVHKFWNRLRGKGRKRIGLLEGLGNIARSSFLNVLLICIPFAWASHLHWKNDIATFILSFLAMIPLESLFDYGGEQMAFYTGKQLSDLIAITLNNAVEGALAIFLLFSSGCELRLLQATIIGVVLLHLLLIPGTAFMTGGARIWEQNLHPQTSQLNQTLLMIGVLSLLVPAAFFGALNDGVTASNEIVSDASRHLFLQMSRGISIMLLFVYVASRIFLHNPPGKGNSLTTAPNAPEALAKEEEEYESGDPQVGSWVCIVFLLVTIGIMAYTAEVFVESIDFVRDQGGITEEWFGLVLLPIVSFSGDGAVAIMYFLRRAFFLKPEPPAELAKGRAIDLSIQFTLFWMPFLVLLSWWTDRPLTLLFDFYEVALVLGACFLVNYVTADAKTNWVEGFIMVSFYFMIALCSWFYPGQEAISQMLACTSVAAAVAGGDGGDATDEAVRIVRSVLRS